MDIYGMSSSGQDFSGVDELLDFSNDDHGGCDLFSTDILHNVTATSTATACHFQYGVNNLDIATANYHHHHHTTDFTDDLCLPTDDVAELEWLSNFVHDSFIDFPANNLAGTINYRPENTSFHSRSRSKRTRAPTNSTTTTSWTSTTPLSPTSSSSDNNNTTSSEIAGIVRRCTHCSSEKTPQWRTGPLGPKTLCNACGVRFKSGRLVPEYRPAASPTFVLTQHSNSHRKVMELRRQKEMVIQVNNGQQQLLQQQQQQQLSPSQAASSEYQIYGGGHHRHHHNHQQQQHHRNHNNYEVC